MNKLAMHYVSHKEKKERIDKYDYCTSNVLKKKKGLLTYQVTMQFYTSSSKPTTVFHSRIPRINVLGQYGSHLRH